MRARWILGGMIACAAAAAGGGCDGSQSIRQNGLVPRPRADTYDGQPMAHAIQAEAYGTTTLAAPSVGHDASNGATVARTELGGALRVAVGRDAEVGFTFDDVATRGATSTNDGNPVSPPTSDSFGFGIGLRDSIPIGHRGDPEGWRVGIGASLTAWTVSRNEDSGFTGANEAPVFAVSVVPSRRFGAVTAFGSFTVMNQIRVPATYVDATGNAVGTDPASAGGGGVVLFGLGARVDVADGVGVLVQATQSAGAQGGDAPMIGAAVMIGGGRRQAVVAAPPARGQY